MPYADPRTWSLSDGTPTAAQLNQEMVTNPNSLRAINDAVIRVHRTSTVSIATNTRQAIAWQAASYQTGITWSVGANPNRLTIVTPGTYVLLTNLKFANVVGGRRGIGWRRGSALNQAFDMQFQPGNGVDTLNAGPEWMAMNAGDWIEVYGYQTTGSPLNTSGTTEGDCWAELSLWATAGPNLPLWTPPRTWTNGELVSPNLLNTSIRDAVLNLRNGKGAMAKVSLAEDASVSALERAALTWGEVAIDVGGIWEGSKFTATVDGDFIVAPIIEWDDSSTATVAGVGFRINGGSTNHDLQFQAGGSFQENQSAANIIRLLKGEYLEIYGYHDAPGESSSVRSGTDRSRVCVMLWAEQGVVLPGFPYSLTLAGIRNATLQVTAALAPIANGRASTTAAPAVAAQLLPATTSVRSATLQVVAALSPVASGRASTTAAPAVAAALSGAAMGGSNRTATLTVTAHLAPIAEQAFDPLEGLVLGQGASVDGRQGDWQDWSWGYSALDFAYETGSRSVPGTKDSLDLTIGPYGTKYTPDPALSDGALVLHSDTGVDWAAKAYTHLQGSFKYDGSAASMPSIDVWLNWAAAGFTTRIPLTTTLTDVYPAPYQNQHMYRFDITLTGAATLGSRGSFGLTPGGIITDIIIQINGSHPSSPLYFDEIGFVATRPASNLLGVADTTEIAQTYNWVPNHAPLYIKPAPPNWSTDWSSSPYRAYWDAIDGNCSCGATITALKWAARKWGFDDIPPVVIGGADSGTAYNVPLLLAAISSHESSFRQDLRSDWQQWIDPQTGVSSAPWCYCTFGIGQNKVQDHPPYPGARLSTAENAELHALTIRTHIAGLTGANGGAFPSANNLRRGVGLWYFGTGAGTASTYVGTDISDSGYVCMILGGTVNEPGHPFHGQTFDPSNPAGTNPSYMALARWADSGQKNNGYWTY